MVTLSSPLEGNPAAFIQSGLGVGSGVEDLICRLYRLHSKEIAGFVRKYARNEDDVSDLVHDVYCKALSHLKKSADQIQNPRAWLYKIARFHCIDKVVKKKEQLEDIALLSVVNPQSLSYEFEENLLNQTLIDEILNYVEAEFSVDEKNIFELKILQGMNLAEVGEIMDVHPSTITRILQRLCRKIGERFA